MKYRSVLCCIKAVTWERFTSMDPDLNLYLHPVLQQGTANLEILLLPSIYLSLCLDLDHFCSSPGNLILPYTVSPQLTLLSPENFRKSFPEHKLIFYQISPFPKQLFGRRKPFMVYRIFIVFLQILLKSLRPAIPDPCLFPGQDRGGCSFLLLNIYIWALHDTDNITLQLEDSIILPL